MKARTKTNGFHALAAAMAHLVQSQAMVLERQARADERFAKIDDRFGRIEQTLADHGRRLAAIEHILAEILKGQAEVKQAIGFVTRKPESQ